MTIFGTFQLGGDQIEAIIDKDNIMFRDTSSGTTTTIHGLRISHAGTIKEHPDLIDNKDWKQIALERLKEHIKKLETEAKKLDYIKYELSKHGYTPLFKQRAGFRVQKF